MNVLIVFAHPESKSFNGSMLATAVETLQRADHAVRVSNLYEMGFNPVPGRHDFGSVLSDDVFSYQDEQKHAHLNEAFAPDLQAEHEKLAWAQFVIFQFPLWWFTMPAILKGWFDRVFAYGYAYGGGRWYDEGVFAGKKAMLALTIGGPESAYTPNGLQGDIRQILFPMEHGILQFVGFDVVPAFVAYSANYADTDRRVVVLEDYRQRLLGLEQAETLPPTRISEFDEDLVRR